MLKGLGTLLGSSRLRPRANAAVGPLLMLSAAFLFAVMDCLIKYSGSFLRVWDIAFYRFGCGMVILLLVFGWRRNPFNGHNDRMLLLRGVAGSLSFLSIALAFRLIPISTALVLFYVFPAFAALFSALLFGERLTKDLIWIVLALCGVAVILDSRIEGGILGQIMSLVGAAFGRLADQWGVGRHPFGRRASEIRKSLFRGRPSRRGQRVQGILRQRRHDLHLP